MNNPKLIGSGLVDCVPQTGKCPHNCDSCFYNLGFYRSIDEPLIPSIEESNDKIVRMNSGHDSALQKDLVLETSSKYKDVFFNTSTTDLNFPGPVVMTANPARLTDKSFHKIKNIPKNLMFVRARVNLWNTDVVRDIIEYYQSKVPVVLTYMRYYDQESIPDGTFYFDCGEAKYKDLYTLKKHILRDYYSLSSDDTRNDFNRYITEYLICSNNIYKCGSHWSSLCFSCGNCIREYYNTKERMKSE